MQTKSTKQSKVTEAIKALEIGGSFSKKEFITSVWGDYDYFIKRSFDVNLTLAKKDFPERKFSSKNGIIIRIK